MTDPTYHPKPLTPVASVPVARHLAYLIGIDSGRVAEGMDATYDGLTLHLSAGRAIVNRTSPRAAYFISFADQVNVLLTDNATNYVYLSYDANVIVNTSGTQPNDSIPLYIITTAGGAVTGTPTNVRSSDLDLDLILRVLGADLNGGELTNLGAPTGPNSAARKQDVEAAFTATGSARTAVRIATTGPITMSGLQTIDGIALASQDRVLVKNQASAAANGIYIAQSGAWQRATDFDTSAEVLGGTLIPVILGTVNHGAVYGLDTPNPVVVGTTALAFSRKDVQAHELLPLAHGAASAPTPSSTMGRDSAGRSQAEAGVAAKDLVNKSQMDTAVAAEAGSRSSGDAATLASAQSYADAAVGSEASARASGDSYGLDRTHHTGVQPASTISDFNPQVRTNRLDQMAAPTQPVPFNNQRITGIGMPTQQMDGVRMADIGGTPIATGIPTFHNFSSVTVASGLTAPIGFRAAMSPTGIAVVLFRDAGGLKSATSLDAGITWASPVVIDASALATYSNDFDVIWVTGTTFYAAYHTSATQARFGSTTNSGASWTTTNAFTGSSYSGSVNKRLLAIGATVFYFINDGTSNKVYKSLDSGGTWGAPTTLAMGTQGFCVFAWDANNVFFLTSTYNSNSILKLYRTTNGGTSWSNATVSTAGDGAASNSPLFIYATSATDLVAGWFSGSTDHQVQTFKSVDGGATWSAASIAYTTNSGNDGMIDGQSVLLRISDGRRIILLVSTTDRILLQSADDFETFSLLPAASFSASRQAVNPPEAPRSPVLVTDGADLWEIGTADGKVVRILKAKRLLVN